MNTLNTIARWIVVSSKDPSQVSLTAKGILVGTIPTLMVLAGIAHLNLGSDELSVLFDALASVLQAALTIVSAVLTIYGLFRKLLNTIKQHQALTNPNSTQQ